MKRYALVTSFVLMGLLLSTLAAAVTSPPGGAANAVALATAAANAENVELVGHIDTPGHARSIVVVGDYAYVADEGVELRVVDVSMPSNPTEVGFYDTPGDASWDMVVAGDYAYITYNDFIANYDHGLRVVDISAPDNPTGVGFYNRWERAYGVAVAGDYAYVAARYEGLRVVDVSDPFNLTEVGFYEPPWSALDVAVVGDYAYVADWDYGLGVVDVSTPSNPTEVGYCYERGIRSVAVAGNNAYCVEQEYPRGDEDGLWIVDISIASNPTEVGFYDTPGDPWGVTVAGNYAYVADGYSGLRVVDVSDPFNSTEVGFYDTPGSARDVAVVGGYVYVADYDEGLFILRYTGGEGVVYSISGYVRDGSGNPIPGVVISAGAAGNTTTNADGYYTLRGISAGTYTLTPIKSGYTFSPATRTVSVPPDATGRDFVGSRIPDLVVRDIEVNQAIRSPASYVAGKRTMVRVSVENIGSNDGELDTQVELTAYREGSQVATYTSDVTVRQDYTWSDRWKLKDSANFVIDLNISGDYAFVVEVDPDDAIPEANENNNQRSSPSYHFRDEESILIIYYDIAYNGQLPEPEETHNAHIFTQGTYPIADENLGYTRLGTIVDAFNISPSNPVERLGLALKLREQLLWYNLANESDADFVAGYVPADTLGVSGLNYFSNVLLVDGSSRTIGSSLAHEIGHGYGLGDEYKCGDFVCGVNPPINSIPGSWCILSVCWCRMEGGCQESNAVGDEDGTFVEEGAINVEDRQRVDYVQPPSLHRRSFMGSGQDNDSWVTKAVYDHLSQRLQTNSHSATQLAETEGSYLYLAGLIYEDGTVQLESGYQITASTPFSPPPPVTYILTLVDADDNAIASYGIEPEFYVLSNPPEVIDPGPFVSIVPYPAGTAKILIEHDSDVLETITVSDHSPVVTVTVPNGGENWAGMHSISWTANDADGDDLSYSILYSPDGAEWLPLTTGVTETAYSWDTSQVPGGDSCMIRVTASDGVNMEQDESDTAFSVAKKTPQAYIVSPSSGSRFLEGETIALRGMGRDPEDGILSDGSLSWSSNISGALGIGQFLYLSDLLEGDHTISLTAADSDDNVDTDAITLSVLSDTDGDGMPDDWEDQYSGLNPYVDDAYQDLDSDRLVNIDEYFFGTDPTKPDTDGDGHEDGTEIELGSDPLDPNSTPTYSIHLPTILKNY